MFLFNNEIFRYKNNVYIFKIKDSSDNCKKRCYFGDSENRVFTLCMSCLYIPSIITCTNTSLGLGYFKNLE